MSPYQSLFSSMILANLAVPVNKNIKNDFFKTQKCGLNRWFAEGAFFN